jgi:hypothetical protein
MAENWYWRVSTCAVRRNAKIYICVDDSGKTEKCCLMMKCIAELLLVSKSGWAPRLQSVLTEANIKEDNLDAENVLAHNCRLSARS